MSNLRPKKDRPDYKALNQGLKQIKSEPLSSTEQDREPDTDACEEPGTSDQHIDPGSPCQEDFSTPAQTEEERSFRFPSPEASSDCTPAETLTQEDDGSPFREGAEADDGTDDGPPSAHLDYRSDDTTSSTQRTHPYSTHGRRLCVPRHAPGCRRPDKFAARDVSIIDVTQSRGPSNHGSGVHKSLEDPPP